MDPRKELVRRLALKRQRKLGALSDDAFEELNLAVQDDPSRFVDDAEEEAFALVADALQRYRNACSHDDLLDDEQYAHERERRLARLAAACEEALSRDEGCLDAALVLLQTKDLPPQELFEQLGSLMAQTEQRLGPLEVPAAGDVWADVFARPRLRIQETLARTCVACARFRLAADTCADLLSKAPLDALGARLTYALALARLEDEDGFNWLDSREGRRGNAWFHLGRVILMYKLGRVPAARRALRGYAQLCEGGSYALLQPLFVETYIPDRPPFEPGTLGETFLAVHEADPVLSDVPDFAGWACDQPGFLHDAQEYAARNGFEWRPWDDTME